MAIESNRTLGFVGVLLSAIGFIGGFFSLGQVFNELSSLSAFQILFGVIGFVGAILFLVAMYGFSKDYRDSGIFNNVLYGFLSAIIGGAVSGVLMSVIVFMNIGKLVTTLNPISPFQIGSMSNFYQEIIGYLLPVLIASCVIALVQAIFYQHAFKKLAGKSEVRTFQTVGLLIVVAAVLNIIATSVAGLLVFVASLSASAALVMPVVGGTVSLVAWILAANAFLSIKKPASPLLPPLPLPTYPSEGGQLKRFCPSCGAENKFSAVYCAQCGKRL
jgi:uncharacterized membrane protein